MKLTEIKNAEFSPNVAEVEINYKNKIKSEDREKIISAEDSVKLLRTIWSDKIEYVEEFIILLLNRKNKAIGWSKISTGGTSGTVVDPKIIFQIALLTNSSSIILAHNHPSDEANPSDYDKMLTKNLKESGKFLELNVIDHIILTKNNYFSFANEGML